MRWLFATLAPLLLSAQAPRINVQNTDPQLAAFASEIVPLCQQWYPRIAEILDGSNPPAPPAEIRIVFTSDKLAGSTDGNVISLSAEAAKRRASLDFRAVVIHELVHVVQDYPVNARCDGFRLLGCFLRHAWYAPTWPAEGIADYVTYTFFTGTNKPYLRLNGETQLYGYNDSIPYLYGLQQNRISPNAAYPPRGVSAGKGYAHGYTVAASFLLWLEQNKDKQIIRKINVAMRNKSYRDRMWSQHCGAGLSELWAEFVRASKAAS